MGADANNLQLKPSFISPQEGDCPGHALQFDDTAACFNTPDNLVCPSADQRGHRARRLASACSGQEEQTLSEQVGRTSLTFGYSASVVTLQRAGEQSVKVACSLATIVLK